MERLSSESMVFGGVGNFRSVLDKDLVDFDNYYKG